MDLQESLSRVAEWAGLIIEFVALAWLVVGILASLVQAAGNRWRQRDRQTYPVLRRRLARVTLLGLELLVAADIIATIAARPTFTSLGILALIVLIRTFLSFALEVEIEGRWPWQRASGKRSDEEVPVSD
ncbi:MAG: DUF1622 domain-containing protein [Trueperaceae bacterium]